MARNRLAAETSPYLLQHADNPVQWWPWGVEALAEAARTGRPILLSIGYAACHWCHVMAHESFEDAGIAQLMNELFVNIKVDREERPDIDAIYQQALALLGQQGGWPLTMFCTPKGEPFWGGTYFPYPARFGRPGFDEVLRALATAWRDKPDTVETNRKALLEALMERSRTYALALPAGGVALPLELSDRIAQRLLGEIDREHGGIGRAPKFPSPYLFEFLWRAWLRGGRRDAGLREAVVTTLDHMCRGGIYDHLGGGFARYSTDDAWLVPHFEKMLYDNAQLIDLLVLVWQGTRSRLYAERIAETCDWILREMSAEAAGGDRAFAASFDADSEGEEGLFYVWTADEIDSVLGLQDGELFRQAYDVAVAGNWENGRNVLNRNRQSAVLSEPEELRLAALRGRLKAVRDLRAWPAWDDKVLADWNGLAISALVSAGMALERPDWIAAARSAFAFVWREMRNEEGRLFHAWRMGRARHRATLDDYASMARAALALAEALADPAYVAHAIELTEMLDRHHADPEGGYFTTASDADDVIVRGKHAHDNAVPAGNGTLVGVFARLWVITGDVAWHEKARSLVATFAGAVERNFFPFMTLLNGSELMQQATAIVVVGENAEPLLRTIYATSLPNKVVQRVAAANTLAPLHPAYGKTAPDGAAAFVCRGTSCSLPCHTPEELLATLDVGG